MQLSITNIQRASFHDGPGIRTTVFLKGCSLRCFWCHNPETLRSSCELRYISSRCIHCGMCLSVCKEISGIKSIYSPKDLVEYAKMHKTCGKCVQCSEQCPAQAIVPTVRLYERDELVSLLLADRAYYEGSGGGVTFSGGEPLLQEKALYSVMERLKAEGISIVVDTAGNVPWEAFQKVLNKTDLFLFDLKTASPKLHRQVTGSSNELILENLERLYLEGAFIRIRIPLILGVNTSLEEQEKMAEILARYPKLKGIDLLPFHRTALSKYQQLGMDYKAAELEPPDSKTLKQIEERMKQRLSIPVVCRGL
ncbi:MAG: glycyl-radical enzyme activating protein [Clostridium sp.]|nr:glycyl-radical enzyme activating protein [Clostridium sp.]